MIGYFAVVEVGLIFFTYQYWRTDSTFWKNMRRRAATGISLDDGRSTTTFVKMCPATAIATMWFVLGLLTANYVKVHPESEFHAGLKWLEYPLFGLAGLFFVISLSILMFNKPQALIPPNARD